MISENILLYYPSLPLAITVTYTFFFSRTTLSKSSYLPQRHNMNMTKIQHVQHIADKLFLFGFDDMNQTGNKMKTVTGTKAELFNSR